MKRSLLLALLILCGCATTHTQHSLRPAAYTDYVERQGLSDVELAFIEANCPFGRPQQAGINLPSTVVAREGYVLEHSDADHIALWVCEHVDASQLEGTAVRRDRFQPDPKLPESARAQLSDYKYSGYDRGHMAPAGDHNESQKLKDETFYLSNMAPQVGSFNRIGRIWETLEGMVRNWIEARGEAYVITGGFFYDPAEDSTSDAWNNGNDADGWINYDTIGKNGVSVPTHFYKIVIAPNSDGDWEAVAFVLEHRTYSKPYRFDDLLKSIDWIEERTGLDFMPDLDFDAEAELESAPGTLW